MKGDHLGDMGIVGRVMFIVTDTELGCELYVYQLKGEFQWRPV